jgi:molybdate-binding protein
MEMIPADGIAVNRGTDGLVTVDLQDEIATLQRAVTIAGCAPALSLWTRSAERWYPGLRVNWTHANSTEALRLLSLGYVHIAGLHLHDAATEEDNEPFVRKLMPGQPVVLVNFGIWEEGLLVAGGNPKKIMNGEDLARRNVKVVNREPGAGSRLLLDSLLREAGLKVTVVRGYEHQVLRHQEVAQAVATGEADAGISTASVAAAYGLGFVGIRKVRYDLALRKEQYQQEPIQQLLNTLNHRWVRSQLQVLGGYDITRTGQVMAET